MMKPMAVLVLVAGVANRRVCAESGGWESG